ncbi:MAG: Ig-like domain-containing protein [Lachnospiraceae bacterium]|nr:Ig-like domain-containing protein [Lachnospiraceae bacterium]
MCKKFSYLLIASLTLSLLLPMEAGANPSNETMAIYEGDSVSDDSPSVSDDEWHESEEEYQQRVEQYDYYQYSPDFRGRFARAVVNEMNKFRTSDTWQYDENDNRVEVRGRKPLELDYGLEKVAQQRVAEIAFCQDHHIRPNGTLVYDLFQKMSNKGLITWGQFSETIAYEGGPEALPKYAYQPVDGWKEENCKYAFQGHRRAMLDANHNYVGIATAAINGWRVTVAVYSEYATNYKKTRIIEGKKVAKTVEVEKFRIVDESDPIGHGDWWDGYTVIADGAKKVEAPRDWYWDVPVDEYEAGALSDNVFRTSYKMKTDISECISGNRYKVKYKSSDKKIAKVNKKGIVTGGKTAGEATITKFVKESKTSAWEEAGSLTVINYYITLPKNQKMTVGNTIDLNSLMTGVDEVPISWESSNTNVVTVNSYGIATAVGTGTAKIVPEFSFGKAKVKTKIKV